MKRYSFAAGLALAAMIVAGLVSPQDAKSDERDGNVISAFARDAHGVRVLWGESTIIDGARVMTWTLVSPRDRKILAVGATFSLELAEDMPGEGDGPDGAIAALEFPALIQETTFFNHLEIHSNPNGHEAPPGSVNPTGTASHTSTSTFTASPRSRCGPFPTGCRRCPGCPRTGSRWGTPSPAARYSRWGGTRARRGPSPIPTR